MKGLINITNKDGQQVVSARELYTYLGVSEKFTDWSKRMFEYGFEQEKDFIRIIGKSTGGRPKTDYALTLDTAKEISMLQRSEKGKQARRYFIECEKNLRDGIIKLPTPVELAKMLIESEEQKERLQIESELKDKVIQEQAPKVAYHDRVLTSKSTYTTNQIAKELGYSARSLNKILHDMRVQYKQHGTWLLYQKHQNKKYTKTNTYTFKGSVGEERTSMSTVWTETGREFIHELMGRDAA